MFELMVLVYPGEGLSWEGTMLDAPRQVPEERTPLVRPQKLLGDPRAGSDRALPVPAVGSGDSGDVGVPRRGPVCHWTCVVQAPASVNTGWYTAVIQTFSSSFDSCLLSLGPQANHFSLSLSFPIYGMGLGIPTLANSQIGKWD